MVVDFGSNFLLALERGKSVSSSRPPDEKGQKIPFSHHRPLHGLEQGLAESPHVLGVSYGHAAYLARGGFSKIDAVVVF